MRQLLPIILFALLCGCEKPAAPSESYRSAVEAKKILAASFSITNQVSIRKSACEIEEAAFWYLKKGEWSVVQITWTNTSGAWMTWTPTNSP